MDRDLGIIIVFYAVFLFTLINFYSSFATDEAFYMNTAKDLVNGKGYTGGTVPPLYSTIIAGSFTIVNDIELAAKIINPIAVLITAIVIFYFVRDVFGKKYKLPVIFFLTLPMIPILGTRILPDVLFNMFFVMTIYFFYKAMKSNPRYFILTGLVFVLAFFTRYSSVLLIPIIFAYFIINRKESIKIFSQKEFYLGVVTFIAGFLLLNFIFFSSDPFHYFGTFGSYTFNTNPEEPFYFYALYFPLVSLAILPFFVLGLTRINKLSKKFIRKEMIWFAVSVAFLVLYKLLILPVREYRYLIDTSTFIVLIVFLGILFFKEHFRKIKISHLNVIITVLIVINIIAGLFIFNIFATFPRYVDVKEVSLWAKENCNSPIITNAGRHVKLYTDFETIDSSIENIGSNEDADCILLSYHEPHNQESAEELQTMEETFRVGRAVVYKR